MLCSGATTRGEFSPTILWKMKNKHYDFGKNCLDFVHLWVKFLIWNAFVRVSRNKNSEINLCRAVLWCTTDEMFIEMPLFQVASPGLKNPWLRSCFDGTGGKRKNQNLANHQDAVTWNLSNHSVKLVQIRMLDISFVSHCGAKSRNKYPQHIQIFLKF